MLQFRRGENSLCPKKDALHLCPVKREMTTHTYHDRVKKTGRKEIYSLAFYKSKRRKN